MSEVPPAVRSNPFAPSSMFPEGTLFAADPPTTEAAPEPPPAAADVQSPPPLAVEVVRSAKRRKTVQAREVNGVLRVSIPASMSRAEEDRWVAEMVRRIERQRRSTAVDLSQRASDLAGRYGLPQPRSIRWVDNQQWRWGSCTPADGTIRISSRLAAEPGWVLDSVIVHELAHLVVPRHDAAFWALVNRYPKAERARGFLMARAMAGGAEGNPASAEAWDGDVDG